MNRYYLQNVRRKTVLPILLVALLAMAYSSATAQATTPTPAPSPTPDTALSLIPGGGALPPGAISRIGIGRISGVDVSPDGKQIAVSASGGIYVYSLPDFQRVWRHYNTVPFISASWSPAGDRLLTESHQGSAAPYASLWDAKSGTRLTDLSGLFAGVWSPKGESIVQNSEAPFATDPPGKATLQLFDGRWGAPGKSLTSPLELEGGEEFDQILWLDSKRVLSVYGAYNNPGSKLLIWEVDTGAVIQTIDLSAMTSTLNSSRVFVTPNPSGNLIGVRAEDFDATHSMMAVFDSQTGKLAYQIDDQSDLSSSAWSPKGDRLVTSSKTELVMRNSQTGQRLYAAPYVPPDPTDELPANYTSDDTEIHIEWSPDGNLLAIGTAHSSVEVVDDHFQPTSTHSMSSTWSPIFEWLPDSTTAVVHDLEGLHLGLWNAKTGKVLHAFRSTYEAQDFAWMGNDLMIEDGNSDIYRWDNASQTASLVTDVSTLKDVQNAIYDMSPSVGPYSDDEPATADSPDGRLTASLTGTGEGCGSGPYGGSCYVEKSLITVKDKTSGQVVYQHTLHGGVIHSMVWSPDSNLLAVSVTAGPTDILVFDIAKQQAVITFEGHADVVSWMAFSPNNDRLATLSDDETIIVWNVAG